MTYRYRGHSMSDPAKYRTREEVQKMRDERDPIENVRALLVEGGHATDEDLTAAVEAAPRLGLDWGLGDDIGWSLAGRSVSPGRRIPGDPGSDWLPVEGVGRAIGWEMSLSGVQTVTPILESTEI